MRQRINLVTLTDVREFCEIVSNIKSDVHLIDGEHDFKINAKSILACLLSQAEWNETYVVSDEDIYQSISKWAV